MLLFLYLKNHSIIKSHATGTHFVHSLGWLRWWWWTCLFCILAIVCYSHSKWTIHVHLILTLSINTHFGQKRNWFNVQNHHKHNFFSLVLFFSLAALLLLLLHCTFNLKAFPDISIYIVFPLFYRLFCLEWTEKKEREREKRTTW